MKILCIKGFRLGGSLAIMKGEVFNLVDAEDMIFEGELYKSRCPGMEINFSEDELANNFELLMG